MKIFILGISGSGKSFLAKKLSKKLNIKHFDLDDLYWEIKYAKKRDKIEIAEILEKILEKDSNWIFDGIYDNWTIKVRDEADLIIWLDMPKNLMSWRIFKRWLKRKKETKESLWETLSLIKFQRNYKKYKAKYETSLYESHREFSRKAKELIIIKNKKELEDFLEKFLDDFFKDK